MLRVKIEIPEKVYHTYTFTITPEDINMADHVGNERILKFANDAREDFFNQLSFKLNDYENKIGIVIANHTINYKSEGFLNDAISCSIGIDTITECSFDIVFHFVKNNEKTMALVRSGCVNFDFNTHKIQPLPDDFHATFQNK